MFLVGERSLISLTRSDAARGRGFPNNLHPDLHLGIHLGSIWYDRTPSLFFLAGFPSLFLFGFVVLGLFWEKVLGDQCHLVYCMWWRSTLLLLAVTTTGLKLNSCLALSAFLRKTFAILFLKNRVFNLNLCIYSFRRRQSSHNQATSANVKSF